MDKIQGLEGGQSELRCDTLRRTSDRFYFFKQYGYIQKRVDACLGTHEAQEGSSDDKLPEKECVLITGTPGIGKRRSTFYLCLTAPLGKTTFLHYYLARRLAQKKITMFYHGGGRYIFAEKNTIYLSTDVTKIVFKPWFLSAACLINSDGDDVPPPQLVRRNFLLILQAASPNPSHTAWTARRIVRQFVLNRPAEEEIVEASVFYSLFLHP